MHGSVTCCIHVYTQSQGCPRNEATLYNSCMNNFNFNVNDFYIIYGTVIVLHFYFKLTTYFIERSINKQVLVNHSVTKITAKIKRVIFFTNMLHRAKHFIVPSFITRSVKLTLKRLRPKNPSE